MSASLSGVFSLQEFTDAGLSGVGYRLYTYVADTATFKTAYTDAAGAVPHTYTADGLGGQYIALNARGELPAPLFLTTGSYDIALKRPDGSTVWTRRAVPGSDASDSLSATFTAFVALLISSIGGTLVSWIQAGVGAVAQTIQAALRERVSITQFGGVADFGTGNTDNAIALAKAFTYLTTIGGGTVHIPPGNWGFTTFPWNYGTSPTSIRVCGAGENATYLSKIGATTTPVLDLTATIGDGNYGHYSDFCIVGNTTHTGIKLTNIARAKFERIRTTGCGVGIDNLGSLILAFIDCNLVSGTIGYRSRKNLGIYCNQIEFIRGSVRSNTTFGWDIGDSTSSTIRGTDAESNGTTGNAATGALMIRSTNGTETGSSNITLDSGSWHEATFGTAIQTEAATGLTLTIKDMPILNSESGRCMNIGAIANLILERVNASGALDNAVIAAASCHIIDSQIHTLTDTSTVSTYLNLVTSTGTITEKVITSEGSWTRKGSGTNSGTGVVSGAATATPVTLFTPSGAVGMYEVVALVGSAGAAYMANARIGWDAVTASRMGGDNGANMTITMSGNAVQATQTSGVSQNINWRCTKVS